MSSSLAPGGLRELLARHRPPLRRGATLFLIDPLERSGRPQVHGHLDRLVPIHVMAESVEIPGSERQAHPQHQSVGEGWWRPCRVYVVNQPRKALAVAAVTRAARLDRRAADRVARIELRTLSQGRALPELVALSCPSAESPMFTCWDSSRIRLRWTLP